MSGSDEAKKTDKTPAKPSQTASRDARLAAALRENLRRRKAQERARGASADVAVDRAAAKPSSGDGTP